jgi:hypothetical protein
MNEDYLPNNIFYPRNFFREISSVLGVWLIIQLIKIKTPTRRHSANCVRSPVPSNSSRSTPNLVESELDHEDSDVWEPIDYLREFFDIILLSYIIEQSSNITSDMDIADYI